MNSYSIADLNNVSSYVTSNVLLDKMERFAKECEDAGNDTDANEVRSWIEQLKGLTE